MYYPGNDTALIRGVKTLVQSMIGFLIGLIVTIWAVPGVPQAVYAYLSQHLFEIMLMIGIPSGLASFIWNALRPSVKNW